MKALLSICLLLALLSAVASLRCAVCEKPVPFPCKPYIKECEPDEDTCETYFMPHRGKTVFNQLCTKSKACRPTRGIHPPFGIECCHKDLCNARGRLRSLAFLGAKGRFQAAHGTPSL